MFSMGFSALNLPIFFCPSSPCFLLDLFEGFEAFTSEGGTQIAWFFCPWSNGAGVKFPCMLGVQISISSFQTTINHPPPKKRSSLKTGKHETKTILKVLQAIQETRLWNTEAPVLIRGHCIRLYTFKSYLENPVTYHLAVPSLDKQHPPCDVMDVKTRCLFLQARPQGQKKAGNIALPCGSLFDCLFLPLFLCLFVGWLVCLFLCFFVCLFAFLFVCLSVCLFVGWFVFSYSTCCQFARPA